MEFARLASFFQKLEETASRNEMTAILADLLSEAELSEVDKICYLLLGRLGPLYEAVEFQLAEKMMMRIIAVATNLTPDEIKREFSKLGDLGEVILKIKNKNQKLKIGSEGLEVSEVYARLLEVAKASGVGSQERKINLMVDLLRQVDLSAAKYLVRIPLGHLRLGLADKTIIDALSWMRTGSKKEKGLIEKAYFIYPDIGEIARRYKEKGIDGLKSVEPKIGVPILPALCERIPTVVGIIEKLGKIAAEPKYDGTRVQLHFDQKEQLEESQVRAFTRNLEEVTYMFPELSSAVFNEVKALDGILDGEVVGFNPETGEFLPFQETVQRKRKYGITEKAVEIPVKYFVFDLLYLNGESLLEKPYLERRRFLEQIFTPGIKERTFLISPQIITSDPERLLAYFEEQIAAGLEGLIVKKLNAPYEAGARGFDWIKFKREDKGTLEDTIDAVVLGYYYGTGKRTEFGIGAFLAGVYDEKDDTFKTIAKIGTGLTDDEWRQMCEKCDKIKIAEKSARVIVAKELTPDVWVNPQMVVVIRADEITRSPIHTAGKGGEEPGFALRFPRLMDWRLDKSAEEATTVLEVVRMYESSRSTRPSARRTKLPPAVSKNSDR